MSYSEIILRVLALFLRGVFIGLVLGYVLAFFFVFNEANANEPKVNEITIAILEYSAAHQIDPLLVTAVIRVESKFDPKAVGSSGEIGLMQLHPRWFADASFDIRKNISAGVRHLAWSRKYCPHQTGHQWVICFNNGVNRAPKYPTLHPYYKAVTSEYQALQKARLP